MRALPELGRLEYATARDAFPNEALDLTPWLAANLDRIGDAIGLRLEDADTEVPVEGFAADVLARDPVHDRRVLIENQLERSDHIHLGQILTYLAGLEASVMVWIAPEFRAPHLAAIRWLNENTLETFAFFAVRLRVARIGNSLPAPFFEVIEQPNEWERQLQRTVRETGRYPSYADHYWQTWTRISELQPQLELMPVRVSTIWWPLATGVYLSVNITKQGLVCFVRGERGIEREVTQAQLAPLAATIASKLGTGADGNPFSEDFEVDLSESEGLEKAASWLAERLPEWSAAFASKSVLEPIAT